MMVKRPRGFYALLLSSSVSSIGNGIRTLIVPLIILYITSSSFLFGVVLSLEFLVWIISMALSGYFIDKTNRVRNLYYSNFILAILMFVCAISYFAAYSYFLSILIFATIGVSIGEAFLNPASFSLLPDIVSGDLHRYNAYISMASNASLLGGYLIAGVGFYILPWGVLIGLDAMSFLISAIIIYSGLKNIAVNEIVEKINFWQDTKEVFDFLKTQKIICYTIFFGILFNALISGIVIMVPVIAVKNTMQGPISLSLFYIFELIGMIIGGTIIATRKRDLNLINYLFAGSVGEGFVMISIASSLMFFSNSILIVSISFILFSKGIFGEIINIPYRVWYQKFVPRNLRSKIHNIKDILLTMPMIIIYPIIGYLLTIYSTWIIAFILGLLTILLSSFEYIILREILLGRREG